MNPYNYENTTHTEFPLKGLSKEEKKLICWDFDHTITNIHVHNALKKFFNQLMASEQGVALKEKLAREGDTYTPIKGLEYFSSDIMTYFVSTLLRVDNIRDLDKLAQKMIEAHEKGLHQAVTSFTWFPQVIKPTLQFILENYLIKQSPQAESALTSEQQALTHQILEDFLVVGGFPDGEIHESPVVGGGRPDHPLAKGQHMHCAMKHFDMEDRQKVCLIDDSPRNIQEAIKQGFKTVDANIHTEPAYYLEELSQFMFTAQEQDDYDFLRTPMAGGIPRQLMGLSYSDDSQETEGDLQQWPNMDFSGRFSLSSSVELVDDEACPDAQDSVKSARFIGFPLNASALIPFEHLTHSKDELYLLGVDTLLVPSDEYAPDHRPLRNRAIAPAFSSLRCSSESLELEGQAHSPLQVSQDSLEVHACDVLSKFSLIKSQ